MSNERNGASRGDVIKPSKTSPPIRRKEKGGLRANLAVRPYPIYRSTRASRAITPSLSFTYAGRYPVVYELFSLFGRDGNCLPAGRLGLPLWCSNGKSLAIGVIVPARVVILDYVSPIAPPRASLRALSPPATCKHIGGAITNGVQMAHKRRINGVLRSY